MNKIWGKKTNINLTRLFYDNIVIFDSFVSHTSSLIPPSILSLSLSLSGHFRGAHPRSYHAFVEVLCNYITERHKSSQGEELQTAEVYVCLFGYYHCNNKLL